MTNQRFSALVVDDEPSLRRLTAAALSHFNFSCDLAADGEQASGFVSERAYDVVITDLRMPKRNGHALAVELLAHAEQRPLVIVLTGVLEPRLATDLITRGVDAVEFKPINFALFGAKVRALCERNVLQRSVAENHSTDKDTSTAENRSAGTAASRPLSRITMEQLNERIADLSNSLPVSQAAIDIVNIVHQDEATASRVIECIARDPGLSDEVLKVANGFAYNPEGEQTRDLHTASRRLGPRTIHKLALASVARQILSKAALPWIDADIVWRRCLATAQAMEHLHSANALGEEGDSLFLTALLLPLSRVCAGLSFPELYQQMDAQGPQTDILPSRVEQEFLPLPPEAILARYLARVNLSPRIHRHLRTASGWQGLAKLTEPLQKMFEHFRIAAALGQLSVGQWMPWDEIDFPPAEAMRRQEINDLGLLINCIRAEVSHLTGVFPQHDRAFGQEWKSIHYFNLTNKSGDIFGAMIEQLGLKLIPVSSLVDVGPRQIIVNCLDASDDSLAHFLKSHQQDTQRIVMKHQQASLVKSDLGVCLTMPCKFEHVRKFLQHVVASP